MTTGKSVQDILTHLNLLGDMAENRRILLSQPSYKDSNDNFIIKGNLISAKNATDTRFKFCCSFCR
jgi:hypothetical protein